VATQIQLRRDTAANWTSTDPTLAQGELGYETDTGRFKLGDGSTAWTSLAYWKESGTGDLLASNNLSDVDSAATSRTNLGVAIGSDVQAYSAVLAATTASFTTADESKLDGIESGATADQSAAEILAALLTVDGTGTGLDADLLDGNEASAFASSSHTHTHADITDYDTELAGTTNTTAFTPTSDYHPATKKYVDDEITGAGGYNDESAQDAVGTILTDSSEISLAYSDATPSITASLVAGSVDETKLDTSVNASLDLADSSVQPGDNVSTLVNDSGFITGYTVTELDVTTHEAALTITESQISDLGAYITGYTVTELDVTTHEAALTITESQISDFGSYATTTGTLAQFAATTSAQLAGVVSDETGSGALVFATSPTLVTPALGTPTSGTLTNCSGLPVSGLASFTGLPVEFVVAVSDETTDLTTGTAKLTFRLPFAMTLTDVRASVATAPTGSALTVDVNESGATILSTKLTIDATEKTSETAATAAIISDSALADDAEITIDIDAVGATIAGAGLKVTLIGTRA